MTSTKTECVICAEKYTNANAALCHMCKYETCRACARTYVLNESEPQCMNCKKPWMREHQNAILKPSFVNGELKKHLEQVMFDRERAQFPATMEIIEERRITQRLSLERSILTEEINMFYSQVRVLLAKKREKEILLDSATNAPKMYPDANARMLTAEREQIDLDIQHIRKVSADKHHRLNYIQQLFRLTSAQRRIAYNNHIEGANPEEIAYTLAQAPKRQFIRACPIETCRGFLSTQWKCGLCETHTCPTCHVPKTEQGEHTCNPDDVATAELLSTDTKPCPKCGTGIFKIDGCDQMWCTECHSAFNWKTGRLETGHVHNPHYFEYQRRIGVTPRNIMDIPCDALQPNQYHGVLYNLAAIAFRLRASSTTSERYKTRRDVCELAKRRTADITNSISAISEMLPKYRPDAILDSLELRVKYLTEEYDEAQFRMGLFREAKKFKKEREIGQVLQTVVFAMTDILNRLVEYLRDYVEHLGRAMEQDPVKNLQLNETIYDPNAAQSAERTLQILSETDNLFDYANECLAKICVEYKVARVGLFLRDSEKRIECGLFGVNIVAKAGRMDIITQKTRRL